MPKLDRPWCLRSAGDTDNPCLLVLRSKGYELTLSFTKDRQGDYRQEIDAEKDGRLFSATTPAELLGLVAMWETRGDDWKPKPHEPVVFDELYPPSAAYDAEGSVVATADAELPYRRVPTAGTLLR